MNSLQILVDRKKTLEERIEYEQPNKAGRREHHRSNPYQAISHVR